MKRLIFNVILSLALVTSAVLPVLSANETVLTPSVVINEIQAAGADAAAQEFIELTNISLASVDITGWKLGYVNSNGNISTIYTFEATSPVVDLQPQGYVLGICKDAPADFLSTLTPKFAYSTCLAASGVGLVLKDATGSVVDAVYWVSGAVSFSEDIKPGLESGKSIQRQIIGGLIKVTGDNTSDFEVLATPSPQTSPLIPDEDQPDEDDDTTPPADETDTTDDDTTSGEETDDTAEETDENQEAVILPLLLSELYIDPADPLLDSQDEWVEIYNPNDQALDLEGYTIYTGTTFSYKHLFGAGNILAPKGYLVITSAESSLALANGGGAAKVVSPTGEIYDQTTYDVAKNGLTWAKTIDGTWSWSSTPTLAAANVITQMPEVVRKAATTAASSKKAIAKKTTTVKASTTTATKTAEDNINSLINAPGALPAWLLATLGTLAVIYCLYEYRFEASNKIYQLRRYRENRRHNR